MKGGFNVTGTTNNQVETIQVNLNVIKALAGTPPKMSMAEIARQYMKPTFRAHGEQK
jgi:hypothetical protein